MTGPALVLCAHGTDDQDGRQTVLDLADAVRRARPHLLVETAYVDVQQPEVADVVARLAVDHQVVVVPLLLCFGYHVQVDIAQAVERWPSARSLGALGPHPALSALLVRRLRAAGAREDDHVVLAAAGSSRAEATADAERAADDLARSWPAPVTVGFGSAADPSVDDAVTAARAAGAPRVVVASYLLGRGFFHRKLARVGADLVTDPLGADPAVVEVILERYEGRSRADLDLEVKNS